MTTLEPLRTPEEQEQRAPLVFEAFDNPRVNTGGQSGSRLRPPVSSSSPGSLGS
jgi:hypothetical protein